MKKTLLYHQYTDFDLEPGGLKKLDYIVKTIEKYFNNINDVRILDVGCGAGNIALPLSYLGYQVTAIDESERAIRELESKETPGNLQTMKKRFENFEPEGEFDVIIMSEFLEHTENPNAVLEKARNILKDSGLLFLSVPNGFSLEETLRRIFGSNSTLRNFKKKIKAEMVADEIQSPAQSPHLHFWSYFAAKSLFKSSGFFILGFSPATSILKEVYYIIGRFFIKRGSSLFHQLDRLDGLFSKLIPRAFASGWLIILKKHE